VIVDIVQSLRDGKQQLYGFLPGHGFSQPVFERAAGQINHDQIRRAFVLTVINDTHDIGMRKPAQRFGFALKPFEDHFHFIGRKGFAPNYFYRNFTFKACIVSLVDRCHTTLSEQFKYLITPKILTNQPCHNFFLFLMMVGFVCYL